jgi:hypothetical protein
MPDFEFPPQLRLFETSEELRQRKLKAGILKLVSSYKMWKEDLPKAGRIKQIDVATEGIVRSRVLSREFELDEPTLLDERSGYAAKIIHLAEVKFPFPDRTERCLKEEISGLRKNSGIVFVIEPVFGLLSEEREKRKSWLVGQGLVRSNVRVVEKVIPWTHERITLWRGRNEKKPTGSALDIRQTRARWTVENGLRGIRARLGELVEEVDATEAERLIKASTYVPRDARRLADGGGRVFRCKKCERVIMISLEGSIVELYRGDTDNCILESVFLLRQEGLENRLKAKGIELEQVLSFDQVIKERAIVLPESAKSEVGDIIRKGDKEYVVLLGEDPSGTERLFKVKIS